MTLATLSFFCRRPTILAIMEFANAVTIEDEVCESFSDGSSAVGLKHDISSEDRSLWLRDIRNLRLREWEKH